MRSAWFRCIATVKGTRGLLEQVYEAIPEIAPHVSRAELSVKPGPWVSSAGEVPWLGYLLMHSRVSRRHLLEMYARFGGACRRVLDVASGDDLVS